jgi:hypothetical protein
MYVHESRRSNVQHKLQMKRVSSTLSAATEYLVRGPFAKFVDSPYYPESELCGGAVTVSFSKYLS